MTTAVMTGQAMPTTGREMLMTDEEEITKENIEAVVNKAYIEHQNNVAEELYLENYRRGMQNILEREKEIRPEINAKIVINHAARIVDTHVGYCFSNPITLVQRARVEEDAEGEEKDAAQDDKGVGTFNKMLTEQAKAAKDIAFAYDLFTYGVGYKAAMPTRKKYKKRRFSPFELTRLNPMTSFAVYRNDAYRDQVLGCTYSPHDDGTISLTAYSDEWCYTLKRENEGGEFRLVSKVTPNAIGLIPIIEYALHDRMGIFEKAIPILDAINLIDSDRLNDIMQHVQSLLWMHNCGIDADEKKKLADGDGVIMTKSNGDGKEAKITYLNQTLNETEVQKLIDHLVDALEQITATPSWKEASGGSTTGAMQLSNGWQCLEISAKTIEQAYTSPELALLEVMLEIIKKDSRDYGAIEKLELSDIEIRFCRTKTYDLVSKTNALVSLLNAGVDGLTAFNTVGLFTDAQQAWLDSAGFIEGMRDKSLNSTDDVNNGLENIIKGANAYRDEDGNGGENNDEKDVIEESDQPSRVIGVES